ncbi:MAG: transporter [Candidatus Nitrotoga sp.]
MLTTKKIVDHATRSSCVKKTSASLITMLALSLLNPHAQAELLNPLAQAEEIQEGVILTDRPDVVESSFTVGKGRFQIEAGFGIATDKQTPGTKETAQSIPTLLRYGATENLEIRLETDNYQKIKSETAGGTTSVDGMTDIALGVKWHAQDQKGMAPSVAWIAHVDLPTGAAALKGRGARPSLRAVMEWEFENEISAGIMPGIISQTNETDRYVAGILVGTLGKEWTEKFRTFVEIAGQEIATTKNGGSYLTYDFGGAYLVSDTLQLDASVQLGANDDTPDQSWAIGISKKF